MNPIDNHASLIIIPSILDAYVLYVSQHDARHYSHNFVCHRSLKRCLLSRQFIYGDHFFNAHHLYTHSCPELTRRNLMSITIGGLRIRIPVNLFVPDILPGGFFSLVHSPVVKRRSIILTVISWFSTSDLCQTVL